MIMGNIKQEGWDGISQDGWKIHIGGGTQNIDYTPGGITKNKPGI
jgi:hypothetical protein